MFRFTVRDLLWLTIVVALGVAWWVDRGRTTRTWQRRYQTELQHSSDWFLRHLELRNKLMAAGWKIEYLDESLKHVNLSPPNPPVPPPNPPKD